jgi:hypothetical protein
VDGPGRDFPGEVRLHKGFGDALLCFLRSHEEPGTERALGPGREPGRPQAHGSGREAFRDANRDEGPRPSP